MFVHAVKIFIVVVFAEDLRLKYNVFAMFTRFCDTMVPIHNFPCKCPKQCHEFNEIPNHNAHVSCHFGSVHHYHAQDILCKCWLTVVIWRAVLSHGSLASAGEV